VSKWCCTFEGIIDNGRKFIKIGNDSTDVRAHAYWNWFKQIAQSWYGKTSIVVSALLII